MGAGRFGRSGLEARVRARELRHDQTYAEHWVWDVLRNRRLDGWKFRRQFPVDSYVLDFYCAELKLVVEVDGEVHLDLRQAAHDENRDTHLTSIGCTVLRISNEDVIKNLDAVRRRIAETAARLAQKS
jgi:very-short-patch-repair endonuclease